MKYLFVFILLACCAIDKKNNKESLLDINFSDDLSLKEFKIKLEDYANNNPYPNIDN
tara:strand:+ start:400 stop:570 length:171 start_codon:yes stop_codon:yes gene_type:complete